MFLTSLSFSCIDKETQRKNDEAAQIQFEIESEQKFPSSNIDAKGSYRKRILHSGYEINFEIINKAKFTTYKDLVIQLSYYSKTKTLLHTENMKIYEILKPNQVLKIEKNTKGGNIENTKTLGWRCISALIVE
ncbi:hypothetical protein SAMN04489722_102172 [Algibacter lectus]|nr:hypothetical protein SAMN04489722_102172 [Algibacter lectus]